MVQAQNLDFLRGPRLFWSLKWHERYWVKKEYCHTELTKEYCHIESTQEYYQVILNQRRDTYEYQLTLIQHRNTTYRRNTFSWHWVNAEILSANNESVQKSFRHTPSQFEKYFLVDWMVLYKAYIRALTTALTASISMMTNFLRGKDSCVGTVKGK